VNDNAFCLDKRIAPTFIASKLAPTGDRHQGPIIAIRALPRPFFFSCRKPSPPERLESSVARSLRLSHQPRLIRTSDAANNEARQYNNARLTSLNEVLLARIFQINR